MLTLADLADPEVLLVILKEPAKAALFIDPNAVVLGVKIVILLFLLLYLLFGFAAFIKVRRLENWLMSLQQYRFSRYLLIHLSLASLGWILALIIL